MVSTDVMMTPMMEGSSAGAYTSERVAVAVGYYAIAAGKCVKTGKKRMHAGVLSGKVVVQRNVNAGALSMAVVVT